jgi:hypothetical protein
VAEANPTQHAPGRRAPAHLGLASVAPATLLAIAFCASVPYLTHRYGAADPAAGYLPFGPLVLLAIACWAAAPLARRLWGSSDRLIRAALLFYCLTVGLGGFTTQFTVLQIPQIVTSLRYFATPQNHFEDEAIPAVADTLLITNEVAARGFYEGARIGGIPWALWYGPLLRWGALAFIYLVTAFAMLAMFRRRWVHHERLAFPLAEIPLFVAGRGQFGMTRDSPAVRRNLLIIGIAIVMVVHSVNALNRYIPSIPQIPLKFSFTPLFENPPFDVLRGASWATAWVNIPLIGIAYLMPSAMALGVFGFFLLMLAVMVISTRPAPTSACSCSPSGRLGRISRVWPAISGIRSPVAPMVTSTPTAGISSRSSWVCWPCAGGASPPASASGWRSPSCSPPSP